MNKIINTSNANNCSWGINAKAFQLCDTDSLSVKLEVLPPNETEVFHHHQNAMQVFFVLSGKAKFIVDNTGYDLLKQDSITIYPKQIHLVKNESSTELQLLVISNPNTKNDRINATDF